MLKRVSNAIELLWPFGLLAFYVLIILSFTNLPAETIAQIFGITVVICAAVAWLVVDYTKSSDDRVKKAIEDMKDVLALYDGVKMKDMPPEVQEELRRRLGWVEKKPDTKPDSK